MCQQPLEVYCVDCQQWVPHVGELQRCYVAIQSEKNCRTAQACRDTTTRDYVCAKCGIRAQRGLLMARAEAKAAEEKAKHHASRQSWGEAFRQKRAEEKDKIKAEEAEEADAEDNGKSVAGDSVAKDEE